MTAMTNEQVLVRRRFVRSMVGVGVLLAASLAQSACPVFDSALYTGSISSGELDELSGLAASHRTLGILWTHNDSGAAAKFYAINGIGGLRGTYTLSGATATDWEDVAVGPGPDSGTSYLYIADTGNNDFDRTTVRVYRIPEPAAPLTGAAVTQTVSTYDTLYIRYPGNVAYDVETLMCDPNNGDLYFVTRDRNNEGFARVFRDPANHPAGTTVTTTQIATIPGLSGYLIKAGDISPDGQLIALRFHRSSNGTGEVHVWRREFGQTIQQALAGTTCIVSTVNEQQSEALGWAGNSAGFYTLSEWNNSPIYFYARHPEATTVEWVLK
ncbi:hypothetical protein IT570_14445 [Candidatus Sumerlaeota bacterium]|nr:hypothetical protein [Candidatus Sumerlaeota bacterium]